MLNKGDVGHEPRGVIKNPCSLVGQKHLHLCDLFKVSIEYRLEIKLVGVFPGRGEGGLGGLGAELLDRCPDMFDTLSGASNLLERVFVFGTLNRTNLSHLNFYLR